jgi:hypothetical protein
MTGVVFLLRLAIIAIAIGVAFPARFAGWLVSGAECTATEGSECRGAPFHEDDATLVVDEIVDSDDDESDGEDAVVPAVPVPVFPARPPGGAIHRDGLTASLGVSDCLFRPPRANG